MHNRYDTRSDMRFAKDAPVIGLVLQRSHLVTGDEGHYSGVVSEMSCRNERPASQQIAACRCEDVSARTRATIAVDA